MERTSPPLRLLVGVDDSPAARDAAHVAAQLARRLGAELFLVHVFTPASSPRVAGQAHLIASQRVLDDIAVDLADLLDERAKLWVTSGIPAERLAALGRELGSDLLVIGESRRKLFGSARLGETHRRLLRTADVPVMVVPAGARSTNDRDDPVAVVSPVAA